MQQYRKAVFIVTYAIEKNKIYFLTLKRKLHWKGWEFPKGGIEENEKYFDAVKRELFEETGSIPINVKKFNYKGSYTYKRKFPERPGFKGQFYFLYAAQIKKDKIKIDPREHAEYKWLSFEDATKMLTHQNQKKCLKIVNNWLTRKNYWE